MRDFRHLLSWLRRKACMKIWRFSLQCHLDSIILLLCLSNRIRVHFKQKIEGIIHCEEEMLSKKSVWYFSSFFCFNMNWIYLYVILCSSLNICGIWKRREYRFVFERSRQNHVRHFISCEGLLACPRWTRSVDIWSHLRTQVGLRFGDG